MGVPAAQDTKERIRDAIDIVELISGYLPLERHGRYMRGLCPFHDDSRPSLQVNAERQSYKCWACGASGDIFSFVMQRESIDFREALELLADRAGIELAARGASGPSPAASSRKQQYAVLLWAAQQFHENLLTSNAAEPTRQYLLDRRISAEAIGKFRLGFAPDEWTWLRDQAVSRGFNDVLLEAVGLISRSEAKARPYDRFRGRLMFPIHDVQGRAVAFGGRVLPGGRVDAAKYINSPETRLFTKANHLFALNLARDAAVKLDSIIVVEGYTDAIMAWQMGIPNVVAVLGTALGPKHLRLLQRYVNDVVLLLDGDEAGRRRANEVLQLFMGSPIGVRIATLPENLDPCDYLMRFGKDEFGQLIAAAPDALSYKLQLATADIDVSRDVHAANAALDEVLQLVALMPTAADATAGRQILRSRQALGLVARTFLVDPADIQRRLREMRSRSSRPARPDQQAAVTSAIDPWDLELLALISYYSEMLPRIRELVPGHYLTSGAGRALYDLWLQLDDERDQVSFADVLLAADDPVSKRAIVEIDEYAQKHAEACDDAQTVLNDVVAAFQRRAMEQEVRAMDASVDSKISEQDQIEALVRIVDQQRKRQGDSAPRDG